MLTVIVVLTKSIKDEEQTNTSARFVRTYNPTFPIKVPALLWDQLFPYTFTFANSAGACKIFAIGETGGAMMAIV